MKNIETRKKNTQQNSRIVMVCSLSESERFQNIHVVCIVFALNKCAPRSFGFISFSLAALFVHAFSSFSVLPNRFFSFRCRLKLFYVCVKQNLRRRKKTGRKISDCAEISTFSYTNSTHTVPICAGWLAWFVWLVYIIAMRAQ